MVLIAVIIFIGLSGCIPKHYTRNSLDSVTLYLRLPGVSTVQFASSLDHYQVHDTQKNTLGSWAISVPLSAEFKYFYIVDGSVHLPDCRFKEHDDFGEAKLYLPSMTCNLYIGRPLPKQVIQRRKQ